MEASLRFRSCLDNTLLLEGGLSDHPDDSGGLTNHGVTQAAWDAYCHKIGKAPSSVRHLTMDQIHTFYRSEYWNACNLDLVEDLEICREVFDSAVLHGPYRAVTFLQSACNFLTPLPTPSLRVDGDLGPKTRARLSRIPRLHLLLCMNGEQYCFLRHLAEIKPSQRAFTRGWCKRLTYIKEEI